MMRHRVESSTDGEERYGVEGESGGAADYADVGGLEHHVVFRQGSEVQGSGAADSQQKNGTGKG